MNEESPTQAPSLMLPDDNDLAGGEVRLIAFYLPQFHPIPENDAWWGPGFTEWTNVGDARPAFPGHAQPHIPADLGYYDLRLEQTRLDQAELARRHGIHGFCYYYYDFAGRKLLDLPLREMLRSGRPDFPFCLCWANESWSRRWDGSDDEVLIAQRHDADSDRAFIADVLPYLRDDRYIRINGAPLLLVYRVGLLPDPAQTARFWREYCQAHGIPRIHLASVESFAYSNPLAFGFDSAVRFPPHANRTPMVNDRVAGLAADFTGSIHDYADFVAMELAAPPAEYRRFPGVMLGWDNTPRRGLAATMFVNATPALYEAWLDRSIAQARRDLPAGERLVFINAWNEWGEGAHLEPDRRHGHAWLQATARAAEGRASIAARAAALRLSGGDAAAVEELVAAFQAELALRDRSIAWLSAEVAPHLHLGMRSRLAEGVPEIIADLEWSVAAGHSGIDLVNGCKPARPIHVPAGRAVLLAGWCFVDGMTLCETLPTWVLLRERRSRAVFSALMTRRAERPDVAAAFADHPVEGLLHAGFAWIFDFTAVPEGSYDLAFGFLHDGGFVLARHDDHLVVSAG
jgi:hypothetical protein